MSKIAFLFPGQGAQTVGMGKSLAESLPAAADVFQRADSVLGYELSRICFEGPVEELNSTVHSQPALYVTSIAALELLKSQSPEVIEQCELAAGLSLGEYTAMVFAGVMDFESGLRLVQRRGQAMQEASDARASGMVSVLGLEPERVQQLCDQIRREDEILQPANYLCPGNVAVSGDQSACDRVEAAAVEAGAMKAVPLAVAGAFHTPIMQSAVQQLTDALSEVELREARIPVVSNVDASPHRDPEEIRNLLIQQVVSPVQWERSMRYMFDDGYDKFYEIGAGRVLRGLLRRVERKVDCENITG